ncbi:uncharacterized protein [Amphiura filiformis]|uniref:uncharacterized protein n=1 Tax=Amphiura filiformis TaxID=82378 RepID=UPI003B2160AB
MPPDTAGIRKLDYDITPVLSDNGSIFTCTVISDYFDDLTDTECNLPRIKVVPISSVTVQPPGEVSTVTVTAQVPVIVEEPEDQTNDEGAAVFMNCGVQYLDRTTHVVSWVIGSTVISDDGTVRKNDLDNLIGDGASERYLLTLGIVPEDPPNTPRQYNFKLFITSAQGVDNGGEFRCAVCPKDSNGICNGNLEYESRVATLEVRYRPDTTLYPKCMNPSKSPTDTVVVLGVQSTLTCESEIANPPVNLQWRQNGQIVEGTMSPDTAGIRKLDYDITPVLSDNGSIFTCTVISDYFDDLTDTECNLPRIKVVPISSVTVQSPGEVSTDIPTTLAPEMTSTSGLIGTSSTLSTLQPTTTVSTSQGGNSAPNSGVAVVGGTVAGIFVIILLLTVLVCFLRWKNKSTTAHAETDIAVSPRTDKTKPNPGTETYVIKTLQGQQNVNATNAGEHDRSTPSNTEEYAYAYAEVQGREKSNQSGSDQSKVQGVENQNSGSIYQNSSDKTDSESQMYTDLKLDEQSKEYETPHIYTQLTHANSAEKPMDSSPSNRNDETDSNLQIYENQSRVENLEKMKKR